MSITCWRGGTEATIERTTSAADVYIPGQSNAPVANVKQDEKRTKPANKNTSYLKNKMTKGNEEGPNRGDTPIHKQQATETKRLVYCR